MPVNMFDQIKQTVAFLYDVDPTSSPRPTPIGTGFFVNFSTTELAGQRLERSVTAFYLFTARHVVEGEGTVWVTTNVRRGHQSGRSRGFSAFPGERWILSESADVAVLDWAPDEKVAEFMCVPAECFATREVMERDEITEGSEVFFAGLFVHHVGKRRNQPIVRSGRVALFTEDEIEWPDGSQHLHLIEADAFPGASGSPVFIRRTHLPTGDRRLYLLGLMKGSYQHIELLEDNGNNQRILTRENMGIAAVVPADDIAALLHSPPMVDRQKAALERLLASEPPRSG